MISDFGHPRSSICFDQRDASASARLSPESPAFRGVQALFIPVMRVDTVCCTSCAHCKSPFVLVKPFFFKPPVLCVKCQFSLTKSFSFAGNAANVYPFYAGEMSTRLVPNAFKKQPSFVCGRCLNLLPSAAKRLSRAWIFSCRRCHSQPWGQHISFQLRNYLGARPLDGRVCF